MVDLSLLLILTFGAPIVAATASITLLGWLAPRRSPRWWPLLAAWWYPLLPVANGFHMNRTSQCEPGDECGGLGAVVVELLGIASILTGFLLAPFAARLTLRYLREA
jgi:hypothetical protein